MNHPLIIEALRSPRGRGNDKGALRQVKPVDLLAQQLTALAKRIGLLGVTFKDGTDDLRESPQIDLLGRLVDAGYKVLAHDRNVNTAGVRLAGGYLKTASPSTRLALQALPDLLTDTADELVDACDVIVVSHNTPGFVAALKARNPSTTLIDLVRLPAELHGTPGYRGICW